MTDSNNLFASIKKQSQFIKDINTIVLKHAILNPELKCLIAVQHSEGESCTYTNVKSTDAINLLSDILNSYTSSTATTATSDLYVEA